MRIGETTINGTSCYLIEDFISIDPPSEGNVITSYDGASVFCSSPEIARLRLRTKSPIFGLWQTLIASGVVDRLDKNKAYIFYTSDDKTQGQIIYYNEGAPLTTSLLDISEENKKQAEEIIVDEDNLTLPQESVYSISEKVERGRDLRKRRIYQAALIILTSISTYLASNAYADYRLEALQNKQVELLTNKTELEDRYKELSKKHAKTRHIDELGPLIYLLRHGFKFSVKLILFGQEKYQVTVVQRKIPDEAFEGFQILDRKYQPDGETIVSYR